MTIENESERMEVEETVLNGIGLTMFNTTNNTTTKLDPLEELDLWNSIIVPEKDTLMDIPEELLDTDGLPPILDYKSVMHNLQKTIAIEHAKKVREGKESVNMNAQLREKYSDYNYHFPDRILNSGLSKKDFTAPFLIDVSQINQDMGKQRNKVQVQEGTTVNSNEMSDKQSSNNNNNKSAGTTTTNINNNSNEQQSALKRKETTSSSPSLVVSSATTVNRNSTPNNFSKSSPSSSIITSAPTLFAMLEQPAPKRAKLTNAVAGNQSHSNNNSILISNNIIESQMELQEEEEDQDDFFPKIVNTIGSFQMNKDISQQHQQQQQSSTTTNTTPTTMMQKANGTPQGQKVMRIPPRIQKTGEGSGNTATRPPQQQQGTKKTKSVRGSGYLGCRQCGKTFPSNCDNLYRSHMLIKHSIEVTDAEIFSSKIQVTSWYKCRKCQLMVLNNLEDHQKKCLPDVPFENAFDPIHVLRDNMPKIVCGVCNDSFGSRVSLRQHLQTKHPNINNKVLLDPFYRCGMCLQNFSEAKKLIEHVHICSAPNPTPETTLEIAQKNLFCEICARKHAKIRETLFCYQAKSLLRCVLCMHVCQSRQNFFQHLKTFHDRRQVGLCCPFCNDNTEKQTREAFDHFIDNHFNLALKKAGETATATSTAHRVARLSQVQNAVSNNSSNNNTTRLINSTTTITQTNSNNNSLKGIMPKLIRPAVQQQQQQQQQQQATVQTASASLLKRSLPVLKPKSILPRYPPGTTQTIQIPASQVLQVSPSSGINLVSTSNGTLFTTGNILTRPVIINRGQLTNMPLQYAVVNAGSLSSLTAASSAMNVRPIKIAAVTSVNTSSPIQAAPTVSIQPAVSSTTSNSTLDEDSILGM